jgi:hypothetical protein
VTLYSLDATVHVRVDVTLRVLSISQIALHVQNVIWIVVVLKRSVNFLIIGCRE